MNYLTFSFDDGYHSWLQAGDLLREHGWHGTFYTCLRNVVYIRKPGRTHMFPPDEVITWDEVKQLRGEGHEIACHGLRHIDLSLCNKREIRLELVDSLEVFKSHGVEVNTFGCPFNNYPPEVTKLALEHYDSFRDWIGVNRVPIRKRVYNVLRSGDAYEELQEGDDKWVLSTWHDVDIPKFRSYLSKVEKLDNVEVKTTRWMYANTFKGNRSTA